MFLSDLRRGDKFRIVKVVVGEAIGKRLVDMGLNRGVEGVLVRCAMLGDPVEIRILGYNLSLRLAEAAGVQIELLKRGCPGRHGHGHAHGRGGRGMGFGGRGNPFGHGRRLRRGGGHGRGSP
jgi:Fe2+ transport system protein FeoA